MFFLVVHRQENGHHTWPKKKWKQHLFYGCYFDWTTAAAVIGGRSKRRIRMPHAIRPYYYGCRTWNTNKEVYTRYGCNEKVPLAAGENSTSITKLRSSLSGLQLHGRLIASLYLQKSYHCTPPRDRSLSLQPSKNCASWSVELWWEFVAGYWLINTLDCTSSSQGSTAGRDRVNDQSPPQPPSSYIQNQHKSSTCSAVPVSPPCSH